MRITIYCDGKDGCGCQYHSRETVEIDKLQNLPKQLKEYGWRYKNKWFGKEKFICKLCNKNEFQNKIRTALQSKRIIFVKGPA